MDLHVYPLTINLWPDLEDLFGGHGACNGCWCMYWRIGSAYHKRSREINKQEFHQVVKDGPPPGLLAFKDNIPVGWCQVTPRNSLPWLDKDKRLKPVDAVPVWCISCFYVRRGFRKKGVTSALIDAAVRFARKSNALALEAYPTSSSSSFTGYLSGFHKAGFKVIAQYDPKRPIMRLNLGSE